MPTSNRPVEPVAGMEFTFAGEREALNAITRITTKRVYYTFAADGLMLNDCSSLYYWRVSQDYGDVLPVLWTVGPSERPYTRLCHYDDRGEYRDVFCMHTPAKCREGCRNYVALWPTRAAALAAGKAFGWSEPVARMVTMRTRT